jgi:hypothetical protein
MCASSSLVNTNVPSVQPLQSEPSILRYLTIGGFGFLGEQLVVDKVVIAPPL